MRIGESPQTRRRGKWTSVESGQLPLLLLPKEKEKRERARPRQTNAQRHSHPSRWTEAEREERERHQAQHQVHPETPPASPAHLKGGKRKKKKSQGAKLPKKFPRGGRSAEQREQSLKGDVSVLCRIFSSQSDPHCSADHTAQKSQVMSLVHTLPLHLVQVGWGSRSNLARKAPHFLAPTPGQILNSLDIIIK